MMFSHNKNLNRHFQSCLLIVYVSFPPNTPAMQTHESAARTLRQGSTYVLLLTLTKHISVYLDVNDKSS